MNLNWRETDSGVQVSSNDSDNICWWMKLRIDYYFFRFYFKSEWSMPLHPDNLLSKIGYRSRNSRTFHRIYFSCDPFRFFSHSHILNYSCFLIWVYFMILCIDIPCTVLNLFHELFLNWFSIAGYIGEFRAIEFDDSSIYHNSIIGKDLHKSINRRIIIESSNYLQRTYMKHEKPRCDWLTWGSPSLQGAMYVIHSHKK